MLRLAIMSFAHLHAHSYVQKLTAHPNVELIGFADDAAERAQHIAAQYALPHFASYEALLDAKPDGVVICAENTRHHDLTIMAAEAGVHVLCEKPLATTIADGQAMLDACEKAGVKLMTAFPMRFNQPVVEARKVIESGDLGHIYGCNTTNQGKMPLNSWFTVKALSGGGSMMDHTVHVADLLRWYLNSEAVEVYAQSNNILYSDYDVDVETGGLLLVTFENGVFASIDCSWNKPPYYPTWGGVTMEIVGENGLLTIDAFKQYIKVYSHQTEKPAWHAWGSDMDEGMVNEFIAAIQEDRKPAVTGYDGFKAAEIALAGYRSVETGAPVRLPLEA